MPLFLVYAEVTYYPWAEVVEADSPELALLKIGINGMLGGANAAIALPLEGAFVVGDPTFIDGWKDHDEDKLPRTQRDVILGSVSPGQDSSGGTSQQDV